MFNLDRFKYNQIDDSGLYKKNVRIEFTDGTVKMYSNINYYEYTATTVKFIMANSRQLSVVLRNVKIIEHYN